MATPTFVEVINDMRAMKNALAMLKTGMATLGRSTGNAAERLIAKSMETVAEKMETRIQEITLDISKLAMNSPEDIDEIMEALSK